MRLLQQHSQLFQDLDFIGRTVPVRQIQLLYNDPGLTAKEPVLFYQLCQLMGQAQQQVTFFSPYAVCNGAMLQQLQQVAQQVEDCRLVVNSVEKWRQFYCFFRIICAIRRKFCRVVLLFTSTTAETPCTEVADD